MLLDQEVQGIQTHTDILQKGHTNITFILLVMLISARPPCALIFSIFSIYKFSHMFFILFRVWTAACDSCQNTCSLVFYPRSLPTATRHLHDCLYHASVTRCNWGCLQVSADPTNVWHDNVCRGGSVLHLHSVLSSAPWNPPVMNK